MSRNKICLYEDVLYLADVRWPSSNPVILNSGSRWTESVRDPNTVARDLLSRMVKLLKGILYLTGQERESKYYLDCMSHDVIYKHQRTCLTTFPNTEKRVENTTRGGLLLKNFEVFGNVVKHCLECLL